MKGGSAAAAPPPTPPPTPPQYPAPPQPQLPYQVNDPITADLLQILNDGINTIVLNIKRKLGTNKAETNIHAANIIKILNNLTIAVNNTDLLRKPYDPLNVDDNKRVLIYKQENGEYATVKTENYVNLNAANPDEAALKTFLTNSSYDQYGLSDGTYNISMTTLQDDNPNMIEAVLEPNIATDTEIDKRLQNCQYLELLYLVKHEELMKTFAFTLNLFDKYKYAIKILLFLLKFLVQKTPTIDTYYPPHHPPYDPYYPRIRLPKTLIPNIQKLLQDQKKVQDVITIMKGALDESTYNTPGPAKFRDSVAALNRLSRDNPPPGENDLNTLDSNQTIPPQ